MFSAPTVSASVTSVKIRKKANRMSSCVVALVTLLNQINGCLKRCSSRIAAKNSSTIIHKRPALPPLIEAYTVSESMGTISPKTAVKRIVCPIGRLRISFSFSVAITTPSATVEKMIVANRTSLNIPVAFNAIPRINAVSMMPTNEATARLTGDFLSLGAPGRFLNKLKLISIPDKNIKTITPRLDKKVRSRVCTTRLKPLLPKMMPTIISATAVGTLATLKRAINIGISRAENIIINIESCSII